MSGVRMVELLGRNFTKSKRQRRKRKLEEPGKRIRRCVKFSKKKKEKKWGPTTIREICLETGEERKEGKKAFPTKQLDPGPSGGGFA